MLRTEIPHMPAKLQSKETKKECQVLPASENHIPFRLLVAIDVFEKLGVEK